MCFLRDCSSGCCLSDTFNRLPVKNEIKFKYKSMLWHQLNLNITNKSFGIFLFTLPNNSVYQMQYAK